MKKRNFVINLRDRAVFTPNVCGSWASPGISKKNPDSSRRVHPRFSSLCDPQPQRANATMACVPAGLSNLSLLPFYLKIHSVSLSSGLFFEYYRYLA